MQHPVQVNGYGQICLEFGLFEIQLSFFKTFRAVFIMPSRTMTLSVDKLPVIYLESAIN